MAKQKLNRIKLGIFIMAGLLFLVLLLYMIGRNRHLFGSNYTLKARFGNVQGLKAGHNVRYVGIEVGTVKTIRILNDTLIEIAMLIDDKMKTVIRKDAVVSISTEGFVGNKVVNILPGHSNLPMATDGDMLTSRKVIDTDEMLRTLYKTNEDVAVIAANLKAAVYNINHSDALWEILNDKSLPRNVKRSLTNIMQASSHTAGLMQELHDIVNDVNNGKGSLGALIKDSSIATGLVETLEKIKAAGVRADTLIAAVNGLAESIRSDLTNGKGIANALLKDSVISARLSRSLYNIEKGTEDFHQDMEALQHNFLLRGYFRKIEKQNKKQQKENMSSRF